MAHIGPEVDQAGQRKTFRQRGATLLGLVAGVLAFSLLIVLGELTVQANRQNQQAERRNALWAQTSIIRAQLESELNSILYLSSGLGSYLLVRNDNIQRKEMNDILATLFKSSRHIRNFGIAIGYRLTYIYPLAGNEQAMGLYYPGQIDQWPIIFKVIESGNPALTGPVNLAQGGQGIIFRVPLFIEGKYWGMLSTVIDSDDLLAPILKTATDGYYTLALRGRDASGRSGAPIWGDDSLFENAESVIQEIPVPGGSWAIAVKAQGTAAPQVTDTVIRVIASGLGLLLAWLLYSLIRNRKELVRRALYDALTELPNRALLEDRAEMAFSRQRRAGGPPCALIFFDLDGFKKINDAYGHKAGDAVLHQMAQRAKHLVRDNDTVARWGGDEFIVLLEQVNKQVLEELMQRLRNALEQPIELEGNRLSVGISMGAVQCENAISTLDDMLKIADQRMYADKQARHPQ